MARCERRRAEVAETIDFEKPHAFGKFPVMTFIEIKSEIDTLSTDDKDRLAAYFALHQKERDEAWCEKISKRLDDRNRENWVSLDDLDDIA